MDSRYNPEIFKAYDIRGVVESDFKEPIVKNIGKAFGTYIQKKSFFKNFSIAVSADVRPSSERLKNNIIEGLTSSGVDVVDIGILPTPINYFSNFTLNVCGSIQITGSHNPSEYNGFKFTFNKKSFFGDQIQDLRSIIDSNSFFEGKGKVKVDSLEEKYIHYMKNHFNISKDIRFAFDCGNACAGLIVPKLFNKMSIDCTALYSEIDGTFPNHHPDPTVDSNLKELVSIVKNDPYSAGLGYDGDADRLVVVDDLGRIIRSDVLMALFLPDIIKSDQDSIIFDVKCSKALEDEILKHNGKPVIWKTGHSLIKSKMKELESKFAGEMSGHIFFADRYFGFDDAVYTSLRLAELLSVKKKKLSELVDEIPKYFSTPEIRIDCESESIKREVIGNIEIYFTKKFECLTIDGVRFNYKKGWGLIRASNTQPVIVCRFESKIEQEVKEIQELVFNKLKSFKGVLL